MPTRVPRVARTSPTRTIGRYAVYGELASGGMATVHFGRLVGAVGFSRPVAIKCLHPQFAKDPDFRSGFIDEAHIVSRIRHQNVVPTLDVVASEDELFLVMEYVQGESLWRLMKAAHDRRLHVPPHVAITITSHILHGLHAAHEARTETGKPLEIVHRDVSPQNVLVGTDGCARVLDFGVARASLRTEMTRGEKIKGKVSYMAPEQLAGSPVTRQADIYAASVILWELLAGRRLFYRSSPQALMVDKLFRSQFARPSAMNEHVSRAIDAIVLRGLAREPGDRYATAREMAVALEIAGKLATTSEVGEWVERMARESLAERARAIADCESCSLPAAQEIRTPAAPSVSPLVASIEPPAPEQGDASEPDPPSDEVATRLAKAPLSVRVRRSLASLLEPDIEARVIAHVRSLAFERQRTLGAALALVAGFVLSIALVRALASRGGHEPEPVLASAAHGAQSVHTLSVFVEATSVCPNGMAAIPGGAFFMGTDDDSTASRPAHRVALSPYCLDVFEVTTESYKACSDRGDCKRAGTANEWAGISPTEKRAYDTLCNAREATGRARHPINCVDWEMARTYCSARGARLPTEAEWELAARGNEGRRYPWGDGPPSARLLNACGKECVDWGRRNHVDEAALFTDADGWPTTAPVGSFPEGQSRFGVQDLVGNVWEWVEDNWGPYAPEAVDDPHGAPQGRERVIRGGGWNGAYAGWMRSTFRYHDPPETKSYGIGFRCAADQGAYATDARER